MAAREQSEKIVKLEALNEKETKVNKGTLERIKTENKTVIDKLEKELQNSKDGLHK